MDKLSALDLLFYKADQYGVASLVMGGVSILAPVKSTGKLDAHAIARHLAARLERVPLLRMKFLQDPLRLGSVRRISDPSFDVWNHVSVESIPAPGGYSQLTRRIAELSARPLDLSELWRWTILDGLSGGKLAVVCQIHHALADGVGAARALSSMYDSRPVRRETPSGVADDSCREPSRITLLRDAITETADRIWVKTPQFFLQNAGTLFSVPARTIKSVLVTRKSPGGFAQRRQVQLTSLNVGKDSGKRAVAYKSLSLPQIRTLAKRAGCTVNDIGLLLYSYALERYFERIGERTDFELCCGMPISTRPESSAPGGNRATLGLINLHNTTTDPVERLRAINRDTHEAKQVARAANPLFRMQELADLILPAAVDGLLLLAGRLDLLARVAGRWPVVNAVLSNVPGPAEPVYVGNGLLTETIALVPVASVLAVSGGISSTHETLTIAFHCDGEAVKDKELFVRGVEFGLKKLRAALLPRRRSRRQTRRAPRRRTSAVKSA